MATPTYLFRFDAGSYHGLGHFSRSVTIAKKLSEAAPGAEISILSQATDYMNDQQEKLPFNVILEKQPDETILLQHVKSIKPDVLFFDKLEELGKDTILKLREYTRLILFHNYSKYATWADAVIIPAAHINKDNLPFFQLAGRGEAALYTGPEYIVLNEKVAELKTAFELHDKATSIAITTGGSDPKGVMLSLLDKIEFNEFPDIMFRFFFGENFFFKEKLVAFYDIPNVNFFPFEMRSIAACDIAIATFGVTTYELLYLGIPVISVAHAQQNAEGSKYLAAHYDCMENLGYIDDVEKYELNKAINMLVKNMHVRKNFHEKGVKLVDGKGVERVKDIILHTVSNTELC